MFRTQGLSIILIVLLAFTAAGQTGAKYRIVFTDKNNSPYSISTPLAFLSQRALDRRSLHGVAVTPEDIPVNPQYIDSVVAKGATYLNSSKWFNSMVAIIPAANVYNQVNALPFVDTLVYLAPVIKQKQANDKFKPENIFFKPGQKHNRQAKKDGDIASPAKNTSVIDYGAAYNQIRMLYGDVLHSNGYTGENKVIAVLDAGFSNANFIAVFDSLWANGQILGNKDFVQPGGNVFQSHNHGTNVLSVMGANIPAQMVGTAPGAAYWLLRSEDAATEYLIEEDNWVAAAEFADSAGADIINSSLTYTEFFDTIQNHTYADLDGNTTLVARGADKAAAKGMILVISAGNYGGGPWQHIGSPADADSVLTIGAVDAFGSYASFSSTGPSSDGQVKPDVVAQGSGTTISDNWGTIVSSSGTSFSAPIISGLMACLWQAHPTLTNIQLLDAVRQSGNKFNNPDSLLGYGIPNFAAAAVILSGEKLPDFDQESTVKVFPNPFGDYFNIIFNSTDTQQVTVSLADITGKEVASYKPFNRSYGYNQFTFSGLNHLTDGIYFLRVISDDTTATVKLLKSGGSK